MPGPKQSGLFVYAKNLARVASFYESVLGLRRAHETPELVVLDADGFQLLVHAIPADVSATVSVTEPPTPRDRAALKFFFTVPSIAAAKEQAQRLGGIVLEHQYQGQGFRVNNAVDPEGNIFHVRESAPQQIIQTEPASSLHAKRNLSGGPA